MPTTQETPIRKISWVNWAAAAVAILVVSSTFLINGNWSNDVIITANTDLKTIVHSLADESTIYLSPNSEIRYKKSFGKKNRYITLKGEAFFEVTPNANLPFRIETHEAMVEVLGTSFTVKSNQKSNFEVIVETGTVSISTKENNKQEVIAQAGEAVSLINNNLSKTAAFENAYQNILSQRLHFKDENLSDIIKVINKNYNVNIILDVQGIENKRLTVTFYNNTIDSIIDVICATAGLEAHYADNTIILSKP
jgi:ferric-dicitrate binding protein FerR (iron transport regulator)